MESRDVMLGAVRIQPYIEKFIGELKEEGQDRRAFGYDKATGQAAESSGSDADPIPGSMLLSANQAETSAYHEQWLAALERLVIETGCLTTGELERRR